ncbi:hypothetical protein [Oceanibaculum indicum]|uniref:Uncharacterized protein n=1 Tax=Oceanibaculum indicum TaxID=526216 RepID=A0A420WQH2_9PROT|nr:hypothetical protein [Oceanibaculum indicum]RKQ73116.1 hypothetical protein BCL74_0889 [Oceanibaculum indicum]
MFLTPYPNLGFPAATWAAFDDIARWNLLGEFEAQGYRVLSANLNGLAPPTLQRGGQTYYLFDPRDMDIYSGSGGGLGGSVDGSHLDNGTAGSVRIGITKSAEQIVAGYPLWWWLAGGAAALLVIIMASKGGK